MLQILNLEQLFAKVPKLILLPLLIFGLLRLVFWLVVFPNPDEAYYWLWGQYPDWSYYDHPPLQAWIQGLFTALLGRSSFTLRLPNLLSTLIFFYTYYQITVYLYGAKARAYFWLVVSLILASPLYFLFLALAWPDHLLITFSLIAAFLWIKFLDSYLADGQGKAGQLYRAAAAIGLAGLCKYNAVFVAAGFLATLIVDRRVRPLLRDRRLYVAAAIAISAVLPILIWNVTNDFQSFHYYFDRSVKPEQSSLKFDSCLRFWFFSILMLSPIIGFAIFRILQSPKSIINFDSIYPIVAFWVFAISTIALTILSLVSAALYYWNITAYLLLFPLLPGFFLGNLDQSRTTALPEKSRSFLPLKKGLFLSTQIYGLLFATLLIAQYGLLPLSSLVSPDEDPDSRMLFGWDTVAMTIQQQRLELGNTPLLITTDYRSASALAYQLNNRNVIAISDRIDQFDFWLAKQQLHGKDALIVADDWHPIEPDLVKLFESVSEPKPLPIFRFGIWIKNYYLLQGKNFKAPLAISN